MISPATISLSIGRNPSCDIRFNDTSVSRRHAEITRDPNGRYRLIDRGSTQGTFVGDSSGKYSRINEHYIVGSETFRFGNVIVSASQLIGDPGWQKNQPAVDSGATSQAIRCHQCGAVMPLGSAFCISCNAPVVRHNPGYNPLPARDNNKVLGDGSTLYAGFWSRVLASLVDCIILSAVLIPVWFYWFEEKKLYSPLSVSVLLCAVYSIVWWLLKDATPGKMMIGARIIDAATGGQPSTWQYLGRYFSYLLFGLPFNALMIIIDIDDSYVKYLPFSIPLALAFMLGCIWVAFDQRKQGWHDKLAGTVVVRRLS